MEYRPRYSQPFTLEEVMKLDVPIITDEIARLQNSLQHLRKTQNELREYVQGEAAQSDPDLIQAFEENDSTIASQEERISMLNLALVDKGIIGPSGHYELHQAPSAPHPAGPVFASTEDAMDEDGGVIL
ncbi:hypothetical protein FA95DRAFT_1561263 [Auriscalpium vulgare]|uniref:Uncharacterized protein n=1 Tax=Auriscalpium vulgare TaxID=40419 RepID=A0ACB8RM39_9AGAM|nr:hypothetical protein FA95DRAFT_1561263 [Auriscalpium vulgare]